MRHFANHKNPMSLEVSEDQRDRLCDIAAYGPCSRKPGDDDLERMGLIEKYDGAEGDDAVEAAISYHSAIDGRFLPKVIRKESMHSPEYSAFLDEREAQRKRTEKNECRNGRHTWHHYYNFNRCAVCGEIS